MSAGARSTLVVGIPRSGSTWIGNVLGRAAGGELVHEPDNEKEQLSALVAKAGLGRFPVLAPGEPAPAYEQLWRGVLTGAPTSSARARLAGRLWRGVSGADREAAVQDRPSVRTRLATAALRSAGASAQSHEGPDRGDDGWLREVPPRVVKSVHVMLATEWLAELFPTTRIVLVMRHPANVLASWLDLKLPDRDRALDRSAAVQGRYLARWGDVRPPAGSDDVTRAAWQVCLLTAATLDLAARRPDMILASHDELCVDPATSFPALARSAGLSWTAAAEQFLLDSDRPGDGFAVQRRAADQPHRWRTRLGPAEVGALVAAAAQFPGLERWLDDLRAPATRF